MSLAKAISTPLITDAYLHVIERDEHGLDDRRVLRKVEPPLERGTDIQIEEPKLRLNF